MIADIILGFISLGLIIAFVFYVSETNKEKAKLVNALIAKTPEQARDLNLADKVTPIKPITQAPSDIVPIDSLSDEEFDKHIAEQLNA